MNRTMMNKTLGSRLFRSAATALAVIGMVLAGASTALACGPDHQSGAKGQRVVRDLPFFARPNTQAQAINQSGPANGDNGSIVGLWHVNYTDSTGQPFYESFKMWNADRTEFETANVAPATGNFCVGVWKQAGPRTVQLNHIGWVFNPDGSSAGYFTLTETNRVSHEGNTYQGVFDFKGYDVNGNLIYEYTGTIAAKRITV
jgi:hypothetical protein